MYVYSLTGLTGKRRNQGRMMVVATVELNRHSLLVSACSIVAGLALALPLSIIVGGYAYIFVPMACVPIGNLLFLGHQRRGLQVNRFNRALNKMRGRTGFMINGTLFDVPGFVMHTPVVVDVLDQNLTQGFESAWDDGPTRVKPVRGEAKRSHTRARMNSAQAFS